MKNQYSVFSKVCSLIIGVLAIVQANTQTTISTITGTNFTGGNGVLGSSAITFVVENTNAFPVLLTNVEVYWQTANSGTVPSLWYSSTSLSGPPTITAPNWTLITTAPALTIPANGYYNTFTGLSFLIPAGTIYRFAVQSTNGIRYSGASPVPSPSTFSGGGVNLHVYNYQISGLNVGYGGAFPSPPNNPRAFTGSITIQPALPCVAPPTAGNAVASANPACPNQTVNLSLSGASSGLGMTYQWQTSPNNNNNWTNITGATNSTYSSTFSSSAWFRAVLTCSGQSDTSSPILLNINPHYNCYCTSAATSAIDEYVDTVRIGNFVNQSFGVCGGYQNFTSLTPPVFFKTATYPSAISTRDCEGTNFYPRYVEVYIDYNQDGIYQEPSEIVLSGNLPAALQNSVIGNITIPPGALTGITGMRVVCRESGSAATTQPCGTYTWGETEDYLVDIRPYPTNDAGLAAIISPTQSPSLSCSVDDNVTVSLTTMGLTALTSADIVVSVNGNVVTTYNWTGSITAGQTATVNIGTVNFNDGDFVKIWATNPNGNADEFDGNDTLSLYVYDALSGAYTVGGTSPNFNSLTDAVNALMTRGICNDVIFNIRPGLYNEQVSIGQYPIVGTGNYRVTFQSETLNANDVTIDFAPGSSATNYLFDLNGADNVTLNRLTLRNTSFFSTTVRLGNGANNIIIENNNIIGDTLAAAVDVNKHTINSTSGNDNNLIIRNNTIRGGSRAIWLFGESASSYETGLKINENTITDYYQAGVVLAVSDSSRSI
ncbi:MAG: GEVED domain-containing protein [Flavobacteriales bacterium]|nr:GEVED domain-containing protein [Flavobacteriales bacterium]